MESTPLLHTPVQKDSTNDLQCFDDHAAGWQSQSSSLLGKQDPSKSVMEDKMGSNLSVLVRYLLSILLGIFLGTLFSFPQGNAHSEHHQDHGVVRGRGGDWIGNSENLETTNGEDEFLSGNGAISKYTQFQALNFQLYTGGAPVFLNNDDGAIIANPECSNAVEGVLEGESQCYMGHENATQDVLDRLDVLQTAVERAYEAASRNEDTLKIFVAPEFFFRGLQGAYVVPQNSSHSNAIFGKTSSGTCEGVVCLVLQGLQDLVADARFQDWLFLFGTTIVSEELPTEDEYDCLFYNFGMLYKGYDPATQTHHGKRFIIPKRYVSTSDFLLPHRSRSEGNATTMELYETAQHGNANIPTSALKDDGSPAVLLAPSLSQKKYNRNLWYAYKDELTSHPMDYTMIEYGWLQLDSITFTVEICLDHDLRSALTSFLVDSVVPEATLIPSCNSNGNNNKDPKSESVKHENQVEYVEIPRHQAQISLVSSAGMTVNEASLALAHQGSIILQDGLNDDPMYNSYQYTCDFRHEWQFEGGSEVIQRNAVMTPTEVVFQYNVHERFHKLAVFLDDGDSKDDATTPYWKSQLRGVFTATQYEPMIVAFEPLAIAPVFVEPKTEIGST
eukprot:CAMPEP_0168769536 /NCGR_PEP_ID=MMETSP0725-20121227/2453_1 /TAXON_ID=265536 /ORGANISM="Amphiprora sp., Strain CCMP467" /LENGTH=615 /DNA_ID=CAMNT_0008818949 /DNA_START=9 /DNA_END=1856 /DNA_ORIENTATION=+